VRRGGLPAVDLAGAGLVDRRRSLATHPGAGRSHLDRGTPEFAELVEHWIGCYGQSPDSLGEDIIYLRVGASWLVAFALTEVEMEQITADRQARQAAREIT
jgi:hypothetical protein